MEAATSGAIDFTIFDPESAADWDHLARVTATLRRQRDYHKLMAEQQQLLAYLPRIAPGAPELRDLTDALSDILAEIRAAVDPTMGYDAKLRAKQSVKSATAMLEEKYGPMDGPVMQQIIADGLAHLAALDAQLDTEAQQDAMIEAL